MTRVSDTWYQRKDEVLMGLGPEVWLRLPAPPDGDDYNYGLLAAVYGAPMDYKWYLHSARRPHPPEQVAPKRNWRQTVSIPTAILVLSTLIAQVFRKGKL